MAYLNVDLDYPTHPKTMRLIGIIGDCADVYPLRLWAYVGKFHARDGRLPDYGPAEIEGAIGWRGEPGQLVDALLKVGFLSKDESGFSVAGWLDHQGHIFALKAKAERNAKKRWQKIAQIDPSNATSIPDSKAASNADSNPPTPTPTPTPVPVPEKEHPPARAGESPKDRGKRMWHAIGARLKVLQNRSDDGIPLLAGRNGSTEQVLESLGAWATRPGWTEAEVVAELARLMSHGKPTVAYALNDLEAVDRAREREKATTGQGRPIAGRPQPGAIPEHAYRDNVAEPEWFKKRKPANGS